MVVSVDRDDYESDAEVDEEGEYARLWFPAVSLAHFHLSDENVEDGAPETALAIQWLNPAPGQPLPEADVLAEVVLSVGFARQLAERLLAAADDADQCMETHPDLRELGL